MPANSLLEFHSKCFDIISSVSKLCNFSAPPHSWISITSVWPPIYLPCRLMTLNCFRAHFPSRRTAFPIFSKLSSIFIFWHLVFHFLFRFHRHNFINVPKIPPFSIWPKEEYLFGLPDFPTVNLNFTKPATIYFLNNFYSLFLRH